MSRTKHSKTQNRSSSGHFIKEKHQGKIRAQVRAALSKGKQPRTGSKRGYDGELNSDPTDSRGDET